MGDNSIENSQIKILKLHAHFHIIGRKSTELQVNPMKDVEGVAETKSLRWMARRRDGITHTQTDEGHFYHYSSQGIERVKNFHSDLNN